jgi:hypothetical protein
MRAPIANDQVRLSPLHGRWKFAFDVRENCGATRRASGRTLGALIHNRHVGAELARSFVPVLLYIDPTFNTCDVAVPPVAE